MTVGVIRIDLRLFDVHSLKQKRSQVSRLLNRLRSKFPLSIAEVGHLDLLQRSILGASMTAGTEGLIQRNLKKNYTLRELLKLLNWMLSFYIMEKISVE